MQDHTLLGPLLGPLLGHCANLARERMDARLTEYDVTPVQVHVLHYLHHHANQSYQRDLGTYLKVKPSTVNGILDRMEEKGLVRRCVSDNDARHRLIILTEQGAACQEGCQQALLEAEKLLVAGMTEAESRTLFDLLHRVLTNLEEDRAL